MLGNRLNHFRSWGPAYWSGGLYRLTMRVLRPEGSQSIYQNVIREIGSASILDLCCGMADLAQGLSERHAYQGIEKNPAFIRRLRKAGIPVTPGDILTTPWPAAECIVMMESLYQFLPEVDPLLEKITASGCRKAILVESIRHVAHSRWGGMRWLAKWGTRVADRHFSERFTEDTFRSKLSAHGFHSFKRIGDVMLGLWTQPHVILDKKMT